MKRSVRVDLHIHTNASDGKNSVIDYVLKAREIGLDVIAITDHNTFKGVRSYIKNYGEKYHNVLVVPGIEVRTNIGDVVVLCSKIHEDNDVPKDIDLLIDWCQMNNYIVILAHPLDITRSGVSFKNLMKYVDRVDFIEGFNAGSSIIINNLIMMYMCKKHSLRCIAVSDAHSIKSLGIAYTVINDVDEYYVENVSKFIDYLNSKNINVSMSISYKAFIPKIIRKLLNL